MRVDSRVVEQIKTLNFWKLIFDISRNWRRQGLAPSLLFRNKILRLTVKKYAKANNN